MDFNGDFNTNRNDRKVKGKVGVVFIYVTRQRQQPHSNCQTAYTQLGKGKKCYRNAAVKKIYKGMTGVAVGAEIGE